MLRAGVRAATVGATVVAASTSNAAAASAIAASTVAVATTAVAVAAATVAVAAPCVGGRRGVVAVLLSSNKPHVPRGARLVGLWCVVCTVGGAPLWV